VTRKPLETLYSQKAKLYQRFFVGLLGWESVLAQFFEKYPGLQPGMKILDSGCGTGSVTKALHRHALRQSLDGISYHAFDLTPAMFEHIPKHNLGLAIGNLKQRLQENGHFLTFVTRRTWVTQWIGGKWWQTNLFDLE
jgi:SAM-dependent methyltransferase